ncbi:hypothetical protein LXL04_020721 [Taraxacum kok-saghyz]
MGGSVTLDGIISHSGDNGRKREPWEGDNDGVIVGLLLSGCTDYAGKSRRSKSGSGEDLVKKVQNRPEEWNTGGRKGDGSGTWGGSGSDPGGSRAAL